MVLRVTRFANLFLVGLFAGILVGGLMFQLALLKVSASVYTASMKPTHEVFASIMSVPIGLMVVSSLLLLFMIRREFKSAAFVLTLTGALCILALMITTTLVNVPINGEIINVWSVENPPADWVEVRDRWILFHTIRTALAIVAFFCLLVAATTPARLNSAGQPSS